MNNTTSTLRTLRNKAEHRKAKASRLTALSVNALITGDIDKAVRLRNKATRLRSWAKRYDMTHYWVEASQDLSRMIEQGSL